MSTSCTRGTQEEVKHVNEDDASSQGLAGQGSGAAIEPIPLLGPAVDDMTNIDIIRCATRVLN